MAVKIDLEKAYDRLNWDFIKETLEDIGLPREFVNMVWHCISSSSMRVLWNGEALDEFHPSRGIRQGDPLSPYLFVLCIEKLFQMISCAVDQSLWKPIQVSRGGPKISYLAFADDVLLFAEASEGQISLIKQILNMFCRSSGQKVSEEKTRIFFSQNVDRQLKQAICNISEFQVTNDLGKYLGVPILHSRVNRRSFQFILDKVDQRLSNWKTKNLSLAGKLTLTKSVLQSMPTYVMQTAYIPRFICDEIDKKCRSFLWGDSNEGKRVHLVNWNRVCTPKDWGGLGLRSARDINQTALMKAGWNLIDGRDDLWVRTIRAKYKCGGDLVPRINRMRAGSNFWRGVCHSWNEVEKNISWRIGDGKKINCWSDVWIPSLGKLEHLIQRPLSTMERFLTVANLGDNQGGWNLRAFDDVLSAETIQKIISMTGP